MWDGTGDRGPLDALKLLALECVGERGEAAVVRGDRREGGRAGGGVMDGSGRAVANGRAVEKRAVTNLMRPYTRPFPATNAAETLARCRCHRPRPGDT